MRETECNREGCAYSGRECPYKRTCPAYLRGPKRDAGSTFKPTEEEEQKVVMQFCKLKRIPLVHIPNEGKRSRAAGARLKAMGLQKGFPDLFIPEAKGGYHGMFLELKRNRSQKPTAEQEEWIMFLRKNGYFAAVCYGADEAMERITSYMNA